VTQMQLDDNSIFCLLAHYRLVLWSLILVWLRGR